MPLSRYYGGRGEKVMAEMQGRYGAERGKRVFYATAEKEDQGEKRKVHRRKRHARRRKHKRYSHARSSSRG